MIYNFREGLGQKIKSSLYFRGVLNIFQNTQEKQTKN